MGSPSQDTPPDEPGLCSSCRHVRVQKSARGAVFLRCGLSETEPGRPRYPQTPVRVCDGHDAVADPD